MFNFDAKAKAQLKVRSRLRPTDSTVPVLVGPETTTVKQCYCLQTGRWATFKRQQCCSTSFQGRLLSWSCRGVKGAGCVVTAERFLPHSVPLGGDLSWSLGLPLRSSAF